MEWDTLLQTEGGNTFGLRLTAFNYYEAKSAAKKLSKGCTVLAIQEVPNNRRKISLLLKGEHALPVPKNV